MAARKRPHLTTRHRESIRTTMLIKRLTSHALGDLDLTASQVSSIKILLGKCLPDLKAMELTGEDGGPVETVNRVERVIVDSSNTNS